jgi:pimeloyl-ACP methyl ester carboxylesterase
MDGVRVFASPSGSEPNDMPAGSFLEFKEATPLLTNPPEGQQAFHVVVPSLPGYTFSGSPKRGYTKLSTISTACKAVMDHLGYKEFYAQGGDWGSMVVRRLAIDYPESCKAIHTNYMFLQPDGSGSEVEQKGLQRYEEFEREGRAYSSEFSTKQRQHANYARRDARDHCLCMPAFGGVDSC